MSENASEMNAKEHGDATHSSVTMITHTNTKNPHATIDEFQNLMEECTKAARRDLASLSTSLSHLHTFLHSLRRVSTHDHHQQHDHHLHPHMQEYVQNQQQNQRPQEHLPFQEFARTLLELETVRTETGTSSQIQIQRLIDDSLDLCGYQATFTAALVILQDNSASTSVSVSASDSTLAIANAGMSTGTKVEHASGTESISSVLSSIHTIKRLLLHMNTADMDVDKKTDNDNDDVNTDDDDDGRHDISTVPIEQGKANPKTPFQYLLHDHISNWNQSAKSTIQNDVSTSNTISISTLPSTSTSKFTLQNAIEPFIQSVILLPTLIANACFRCGLRLPSWANRSKFYSRLVHCACSCACTCTREGPRASAHESENVESIYWTMLLQKLVHLGSFESASSGMYKFWKNSLANANANADEREHGHSGTKDGNARTGTEESHPCLDLDMAVGTLRKACMQIQSPRQSASLLCSTIQLLIHNAEGDGSRDGHEYRNGNGNGNENGNEDPPPRTQTEMDSSLCQKYCMPYLELIWLPIVSHQSQNQEQNQHKNHNQQQSSMVRDAFVRMVILAPSPSADERQVELLVRCVVLLLSLCQERHSNDLDDDDSDSDSGSSSSSDSGNDSDDFDLDADDDYDGGKQSKQMKTNEENGKQFQPNKQVLMKHLVEVASVWSDASFIRKTDSSQQRHVSLFLLYAIEFMDKDQNQDQNQDHHYRTQLRLQQMVSQELVMGITSRLKVMDRGTRIDGMRVAEKLAPVLGQSLTFEELDGSRDEPVAKDPEERDVPESSSGPPSNTHASTTRNKVVSKRRHRKRERVVKAIDPDEEYFSGDESESDSSSGSEFEDFDSICSSDSDWDEEGLIALDLEDDEDDLRVVPKPNYLRECLDLLRADGDGHDAVCKQETALKEIPILVRAMPPDLNDVAVSLANELFHMENKFDLNEFIEMRFQCLYALVVCEPLTTLEYLQGQIFTEISLAKRFDVLEVMKKSAFELSGQLQMERNRMIESQNDDQIMTKVAGKRSLVPDDIDGNEDNAMMESAIKGTMTRMKTRRWGRGRRNIRNKSVTNSFGPVASSFFYPLLQGFVESKSDEVIWGGDSGGTLLSHLIIALSSFVEYSGYHPGTAVLAKDLFEVSWSLFIAENGEVRQAVLIALATCLSHLPEEYVLRVVVGINEVPRVLAMTMALDTNENCRLLAQSINDGLQRSIMF